MTSYGVDTNWYMDMGATDHIAGELDRLTVHDHYNGGDQVHTASGSGMKIDHIGHSTLCFPSSQIHLKMSYMSHKLAKILFQSIELLVTTMCS